MLTRVSVPPPANAPTFNAAAAPTPGPPTAVPIAPAVSDAPIAGRFDPIL